MLIVFQDGNTTNNFAHGQNGLKPITSFAASFSNGATDLASTISTLYVSLPELGMQWPNPTYNLGASKAGWEQAYADFIHTCRGSSGGYEGSVPIGSLDPGPGAAIIFPGAGTVTQFGDPNNDQQLWLSSSVTIPASTSLPVIPVPTATFANQTALWGYLGRCPGPIFAVPIVRPPDKMVTNADINVTFTGNGPTNVVVSIIQIFSMALVCESNGFGKYAYEIVRGL